jgi:SagB-type dehydrogenase family enzyme
MRTAPVSLTAAGSATMGGFDTARAYAHATGLRTDPRSANPPDWRVDWADGPWPVKVHDGGARVPLHDAAADVVLGALGRLLFHTFAVSRLRHDPRGGLPATPGKPALPGHGSRVVLRRPVPSGGSMYPTEAYVVCTDAPHAGVLHYDPYRHELIDLGMPGAQVALAAGLDRSVAALPAVTLVLTNRFWKNFYKYGDFAYRLGAVDVGVALGRVLRLAPAAFGAVTLWTSFADEDVNGSLGLSGRDESAYAVVGLTPPTGRAPSASAATAGTPPVVLERSRRIKRSPRFDAMHDAARVPVDPEVAAPPVARPEPVAGPEPVAVIALPPPVPVVPQPADMLRRTSNGALFDGRPATARALATVLRHAAAATHVAAADTSFTAGLSLYVAVHRVTGIPGGWYRYRPATGDLVMVGAGTGVDPGRELQAALLAESLNIELAAFTIHVSAPVDFRSAGRGVRGYREQQMGVGVVVEAVTLLAATVGLGSHPVLGFDVSRADRAYGLAGSPDGTQAQVSVGAVRPDLNWEVSVMPR